MEDIHKNYKRLQIDKLSDLEAIVLLYNEAIKEIEMGKVLFLEAKPEYTEKIDKAQKVIRGLCLLLDFKQGGTIAENLYSLYNYMDKRLTVAKEGIRLTVNYLEEVVSLLNKLLEAWDAVAKEAKATAEAQAVKPTTPHLEITI
jgi:flagellar secretion chaperone FliS